MSQSSQVFPTTIETLEAQLETIFAQIPADLWPLFMDKLFQKQSTSTVEACAVTLLNRSSISMFGRKIKNPYADPFSKTRKEYHVHPYPKQGSGVSVTLMYTDPETLEISVLLARKKNDTGQYEQIGGYTKGHWPEGGETAIDQRSEDKKDQDEEELIGNNNAVHVSTNTIPETLLHSNYTLTEIKPPIKKIYREMLATTSMPFSEFHVNPVEMKQQLLNQGIVMQAQFNAEEAALDEVVQETGLDLRKLGKRPQSITCTDDFCISNENEKLHTLAQHFMVNLGMRSDPPEVKPGSDIGALEWVPVSKIILADPNSSDPRSSYQDRPIRLDYGTVTLSACLKKARCQQLYWQSRNRFSTPENVEMALRDAIKNIYPSKEEREEFIRSMFGLPPRTELGIEAHLYHLKILKAAQFIEKVKIFNKASLEELRLALEEEQRLVQPFRKYCLGF